MNVKIRMIIQLLILIWISPVAYAAENHMPPIAKNLQFYGQLSDHEKLPLLLYFSAEWCAYCELLNEAVIQPTMLGGGLDNGLILMLKLDDHTPLIDFDGAKISPQDFANKYDVDVTPTILYLDARGKEIAPKIVGISNIDYYYYDLHQHAEIAKNKMRNE